MTGKGHKHKRIRAGIFAGAFEAPGQAAERFRNWYRRKLMYHYIYIYIYIYKNLPPSPCS